MNKLIALALVLVVAVGGVGGAVVLNSPSYVAANALTSFVDDLLDRDEIAPIYSAVTGGSIEASVSNVTSYGDDVFDGKASGKIYFAKNKIMLTELNINIDDFEIKNGEIYMSEDVIYVSEDKIVGDAYGVKLSELADNLADSIFAADSGSDYAMDKEIYEKLMDALESTDNKKLTDDAEKLIKTLVKDLFKIVLDNAEIESESASTRIGGKKTDVRMVTITIDDEAVEGIIKDAYDYLLESKDIEKFLEKHEDALAPLLAEVYDDEKYDSLSEAYYGMLEEAEDDVEDMCDSISDGFEDITLEIATPKLTTKLLKLELKVGKESIFTLDCGKDGIKDSDKVTLQVGDDIKVTYEVKESDSKSYQSCLSVDQYGDVMQYTINIDKQKETYKVTVGEKGDDESYVITGDFITKGDATTITIGKLACEEDGESEEIFSSDITITIEKSDKMPSPIKDFKTIADIKEDDIERWMEKIG